MLFPPSKNSTSETMSRRNMPSYSCSSSRHLPTRLLQLCPLRSAFIHTTTLILGTPHCCSPNKRSRSYRDHITLTLKQLQWLPIHARIAFKISLLMYHIHSGTSPSYMSSMVTPCSRYRGLRSSTRGDFAVIRTNLKFGNRAFSVAGPREWNSLPVSVRQCTSVAQFKSKLKIHLFSLYYDYETLSCKTCFC